MVSKVEKILENKSSKYYIQDASKDYHCRDGMIPAAELKKSLAKSSKGAEFAVYDPSFLDVYEKINRGPQIVSLKDIGSIIAHTGISKDSVVVDSGAGSGALCCFLAHIAKKVTSYELREDFFKIASSNKSLLNLKNLTIKHQDITLGIDEKNVDLITLDLPAPWLVVAHAVASLKQGGFLVNYSPTIPQVSDFVEKCLEHSELIHLMTVEITEREWDVDKRKLRPKTSIINHTGFISFMRKIYGTQGKKKIS